MNGHLRKFEEHLAARLAVLFWRWPELCGFTVHEDGPVSAHLAYQPAQGGELAELMAGEIAEMLAELVEEQPDAAELLQGRTFARTLH